MSKHKVWVLSLIFVLLLPTMASSEPWEPDVAPRLKVGDYKDLVIGERRCEVYEHGSRKEWGYAQPQKDTFIVVHPKKKTARAPLYVVLHSAGHDAFSALKCTRETGNHDIYRSPDNFYALYLDCRANKLDWWWGGLHSGDTELIERNAGGEPRPVEKRVVDTVKWVIDMYGLNKNRVYLSGNSMGGSGALGIGMRNGDLFASVKANVPASTAHVSNRMYFSLKVPQNLVIPDPPVVVDYSAPNDGWSFGHRHFLDSTNQRKYALYAYWGPFGHANNHAEIEKVNDLINTFDWLSVRKDQAYPVFTNASCNDTPPWPEDTDSKVPGQINAFFRWRNISDEPGKLAIQLMLATKAQLKTRFDVPGQATADVSVRRLQRMRIGPGTTFNWRYGELRGTGRTDSEGVITVPQLKITPNPTTLVIST